MNEDSDIDQHLQKIILEIQHMQRDITHGSKKPHKLVMLLAVVELFDKGILKENKIYFDTDLTDSFATIFNLVRKGGDWNQPAPPYFHLRTSDFWCHKIKPGRETQYAKLRTSGGGIKRILDNIEYSSLSDDCYQVMMNNDTRHELKEFLINALNPYSNFDGPAPLKSVILTRR